MGKRNNFITDRVFLMSFFIFFTMNEKFFKKNLSHVYYLLHSINTQHLFNKS